MQLTPLQTSETVRKELADYSEEFRYCDNSPCSTKARLKTDRQLACCRSNTAITHCANTTVRRMQRQQNSNIVQEEYA